VEYRTLHPGDAVRWILSRARVVDDHDSASARLIGVTLDVTEHRKAEEERARLRTLELTARAEAMERKRIGRELHDRVAHSMGVVHQSLELYGAYAKKDPALAAEKLQLAKESTRRALDQTRNLSSELERSHVEDTQAGVVAAVRALLKTHVPPGVEATLSVSSDDLSVPPLVGEQVYLVMREAVRNAVAHSACGRIRATLKVRDGELYGSVVDDGVGFDPDGKLTPGRSGEDSSDSGIGLRSMRERAELLSGEVVVSSKPGWGTRVEVRGPLE
jgi:signal transduction histidine kinase